MVTKSAGKPLKLDQLYAGILLLFVITGGYSMYREALPFLFGGGSLAEKKRYLVSGVPRPAISEFGNRIYIDACFDTLSDPLSRLENPQLLVGAAENCLKFSQQQIEKSPANSYAYAIAAIAHLNLSDQNAALTALEKSRSIAPSEVWLSSLRLRQFRQIAASSKVFSPYVPAQDIMTMGKTNIGRNWLAAWYKNDAGSRPLIVQGVDMLKDSEKNAFLRSVKR